MCQYGKKTTPSILDKDQQVSCYSLVSRVPHAVTFFTLMPTPGRCADECLSPHINSSAEAHLKRGRHI